MRYSLGLCKLGHVGQNNQGDINMFQCSGFCHSKQQCTLLEESLSGHLELHPVVQAGAN